MSEADKVEAAPRKYKGRPSKGDSDELKMQFGIWLGLPEAARDPKTVEAFSKAMGISMNALNKWRDDPFVQDAQKNALRLFAGSHKVKIINKIISQAEAGEYQQQRLFLEWQGDIGTSKDSKGRPRAINLSLTTDEPASNDG